MTTDYNQIRNEIWKYKLLQEFHTANALVRKHLKVLLTVPNFDITSNIKKSRCGEWCCGDHTMRLNVEWIQRVEWKHVRHTIRHEMAHQIVDEVFKVDDCTAHGEYFARACNVLEIDASATHPMDVADIKENPIASKITKLLNKANDSAVTKEEAEIFLNKAYEMMQREKITISDAGEIDEIATFVFRPVGDLYKRLPPWINGALRRLMRNYYNVRTISTWYINKHRIEIFGKIDDVEIAAYIYENLIRIAENEWKKFYWENKKRGIGCTEGGYSKNGFYAGLIDGFAETLKKTSNKMEKIMTDPKIQTLVKNDDAILEDKFCSAYPNMRNVSRSFGSMAGRSHGSKVGSGIRINKGMNSGRRMIGG